MGGGPHLLFLFHHAGIGLTQQHIGRHGTVVRIGQAESKFQRQAAAGIPGLQGLADDGQTFAHHAAGAGEHQYELVPAQTRQTVFLPDMPRKLLGRGTQQFVTGMVPEMVVDHLQAVDIGHEDAQGAPAQAQLLQQPVQMVTVVDTCQGIHTDLLFQHIAVVLQGTDVRMHAHDAQGVSPAVPAGHAAAPQHPQPGAVGLADAVGAGKGVPLRGRRRHPHLHGHCLFVIVRMHGACPGFQLGGEGLGRVSQHGQIILAVIDLAGGGVPVPQAVAAGIHGQQQAVGAAHRGGLARQEGRQTARDHQGPPVSIPFQDRGRQQQGQLFGTGGHQQQGLPSRTQGDVQPAAQARQCPRCPVTAAQKAQAPLVQRPRHGAQAQQDGTADVQQQVPFFPGIGPVAGVVPHRQGNVVQQVDRGKDRPRPAVGAAPDDVQRLADPPAVAGIGTGLAAGALPGQDHLALALQGTALGFRQPVQEGRHGLRRRLRCQSQQEQGRRTEDEPVRREVPGETGGGMGRKRHGPSLVSGMRSVALPYHKLI